MKTTNRLPGHYFLLAASPQIFHTNSPVDGTVGQNASLVCKATGDPEPSIYWIKVFGGAGDRVSSTKTLEFSNATLSASNSTGDVINITKPDYGVYLCYANNSYGADSQNVTLNVQCRLDFPLFIFLYEL